MTLERVAYRVEGEAGRPKTLAAAAEQFEALLIAQLLKSARESSSGGWTGTEGGPLSSLQEIAEQCLAEVLASKGGFGLSDMIVSRMETNRNDAQDGPLRADK